MTKELHLSTLLPWAGEVSRLVDVHVVRIHLTCHDDVGDDGEDDIIQQFSPVVKNFLPHAGQGTPWPLGGT